MYTYKYPHPSLTADCIVIAGKGEERKVLLIRRGHEPYKDHWAFPGGFMNIDETTRDAASRELKEETGIDIDAEQLRRVDVFDAVDRDPRERVISVAYLAEVDEPTEARGADDAAEARWFPLDSLPPLAFDHRQMIEECKQMLGVEPLQ